MSCSLIKMAQKWALVFLIALSIKKNIVDSANILALTNVPSPSHHIWNRVWINALAARGHNVTVVSPDKEDNPPANVTYIHLEEVYPVMHDHLDLIEMSKENAFYGIKSFYAWGEGMCKGTVASKGLQTLLNYPDDFKFDLVVYDFTCGPCLLGFLHKFKYPPVVGVAAFNNPPFTSNLMGGHKQFGYVPYYTLHYDAEMSFIGRLHNALIYILDDLYRNFIAIPDQDRMMRTVFKWPEMPYADDLDRRILLALVNKHEAIDFVEPLPPNVIPVGGLQIQDPKPLDKKVNNFLSKGDGAVLFALGTNMRSDMLGEEKIKAFIEVFKQFSRIQFLWKFESDKLPASLPNNVMIVDWISQNDALAHPNVKAFISHAGLLSTHEAAYHGVPVIGIPFFCDQHRNIYKAVRAGVAEEVPFEDISVETVKTALTKVLHEEKYQIIAKLRAQRFRDQKEKPLERAIWWIEWVLRNPNPTHLQSPVRKIGHFRANMYDFLFVVMFAAEVLVWFLVKSAYRYGMKTGNKEVKGKEDKKKD